ncbi:MAG: trehalose-phosphatase [Elusimicrobia bacterium]|nr:trehalose-phosphatase [Elusimicrobiota bacterium]
MKGLRRLQTAVRNGFKGKPVLLGLDFDGTLCPIAPRPEVTCLAARTRELLGRLRKMRDVSVAVVSGREVQEVRARVGLPGVYYVGNHGLEIQGPKIRWRHPEVFSFGKATQELALGLGDALEDFSGAWLENKGLTLSLHFRDVPSRLKPHPLRKLLGRFMRPYRRQLMIYSGKKVWEVRPRIEWNKGKALLKISRRLGKLWKVVFIGDDFTDEEGFRVLKGRGVTARIGHAKKTAAGFILKKQMQVNSFLQFMGEHWV